MPQHNAPTKQRVHGLLAMSSSMGFHPRVTCGLGTQAWGFAPIGIWAKIMKNFEHEKI